jgi:hypothetical protein
MEHVAGQAGRMQPHEKAVAVADVAAYERDVLFAVRQILVRVDFEVAEFCRELRPCRRPHER